MIRVWVHTQAVTRGDDRPGPPTDRVRSFSEIAQYWSTDSGKSVILVIDPWAVRHVHIVLYKKQIQNQIIPIYTYTHCIKSWFRWLRIVGLHIPILHERV